MTIQRWALVGVGGVLLAIAPIRIDVRVSSPSADGGARVSVAVRPNEAGACCGLGYIKRAARSVGRAVSRGARAVARGTSDAARATARAASDAADAARRAARRAADAARRALDEIEEKAEKAAKAIRSGLKKVGSAIVDIGKKLGAQIATAAKFVREGLEYLVNLVADFWEMIVDWVVSKAKEYAKRAVDKAKAGVQAVFASIKDKARQASEKLLRPVLNELASNGIKLPFPQIERLAKLQRGGKLDENAIRAEVRKFVLGHLDQHIVPHVKWAVTEGIKTLKTAIDTAVRGVASGLGSIPIVGGPVFAAVIFTYNFAFEQVTTAISQAISNLVKNTMLGEIVDQLLKPIIKKLVAQVQKLIDATGIPQLAAKITAEVKRDIALGKKLLDSMKTIEGRIQNLEGDLRAKVEAVVARKIAAEKKFSDVVAQVVSESQKAAGAVPAGTPPAGTTPGGRQ